MILEDLRQLAIDEDLVGDPNYQLIPVAWAIRLNKHGKFLGYEDIRVNIDEGKLKPDGKPKPPKWMAQTHYIPRQQYRSNAVAPPRFLADNLKYIFGNDGEAGNGKVGLQCTNNYRVQVQQCVDDTQNPLIAAIATFLRSHTPGAAPPELPKAVKPGQQFIFKVGDTFIHTDPQLQQWWAGQNAIPAVTVKKGKDAPAYQCIVTGEPFHTLEKFPSTPGIPGASNTAKLLSLDKKTFWSQGWKTNENAPVCRDAAIKISTALTRLLAAVPKDGRGNLLARRNLKLPGAIAFCYWAVDPSPLETAFLDQFWSMLHGTAINPKSPAKALVESVWRGEPALLANPSQFCALMISGSMTRGSIRGWVSTKFNQILDNLSQHYNDMKMVRHRPDPGQSVQVITFTKLMKSLLLPKGTQEPISRDQAAFLAAILNGTAYPVAILSKAVQRTRAEIGGREPLWSRLERLDARASLIKAVMNRQRRINPAAAARYPELTPDMNPSNCLHNGYRLGVLMAVLERLQQAALGMKIKSTIVDRYFTSASCTPQAAFSRLLRTARYHHEKTTRASSGGDRAMGWRCDRLIDWLLTQVGDTSVGLPVTLDLEQQGHFTVAYHQMRHWLWMPKEARQQWEAAHADCPEQFRWAKEPAATAD